MGKNEFYVYIMLDQRKKGIWKYDNLIFNNKPFYIGIGKKYRMTAHFTPYNLKNKSIKNNIINSIFNELNEYPIYYKIYSGLTYDEAIKKETDIIQHFGKIKDDTGILSNLTDGGDGISGFNHKEKYKQSLQKKVYQYNLNGEFIKEWKSLKSVIEYYGMSGGGGIRLSTKTNAHCYGFLWSYIKKDKLKKHKSKNTPKYVYSIYLKDKLIRVFKNYQEMDDFFGKKISRGNVSMCCKGKIKSYLGYVWVKDKIN